MVKALKIAGVVLVVLVTLLIAGVVIVTQLIDPNDYKPQIRTLAEQNANLDLRIEGDLDWSFWPSLGVDLGRTEARIAGTEELFAAFDRATVGIAIWPLLFGEIQMDDVVLDGLEMNLVQTPDGANWERIGPQAPAEATPEQPAEQAEGDAGAIALFVPELDIRDARVRYRAPADDVDMLIEHVGLHATEISLDEPFDVTASFRYQDQADVRVDSRIAATVFANLEQNLFRVSDLDLMAEIGGVTANPVPVNLTGESLEVALDEDRASVRGVVLDVAGVTTRLGADVAQLASAPVIRGELETAPFDANVALRNLGMAPISTTDPTALQRISFKAALGGEPNSLMLEPLVIAIDDTTVRGRAGVSDFDSMAILFDLALDRFVADGYLPPEAGIETSDEPPGSDTAGVAPEPAAGSGILPPLSDDPLLPLDALRALNVEGKLVLGEVSLEDIVARDIAIEVSARDGTLALGQAGGTLLDGTFTASGSLDASQDAPPVAFNAAMQNVNLTPLVKYGLGHALLSGAADADLRFSSRGNSEQALLANAGGMVTFAMADATLHGISLHDVLIGGVNDMLGSVSGLTALLPGQASGKLPRELREDTRLADLTGKARLEKETVWIDRLAAELEDGAVLGEGYLNLRSGEFDMQLGVRSERFTDNKYFANRTWPIRCRGELTGSPARWCGPDMGQFREMGKDIAAQAAKQRVKDELGIEAEGDTTQEVIRDAARKKAKDELEKKARDELKKLFQ